MKGIEIVNYGGPKVAKVRTFNSPVRRAGEVMIQVVASSINPVDIKYMTPETIQKVPSFPTILDWDIAGIIIEADMNSNFSAGERVVAFHPQGSWQCSVGYYALQFALKMGVKASGLVRNKKKK